MGVCSCGVDSLAVYDARLFMANPHVFAKSGHDPRGEQVALEHDDRSTSNLYSYLEFREVNVLYFLMYTQCTDSLL